MGTKKLQILLPTLFALVMVAGMMIGYELHNKSAVNKFFAGSNKSAVQEVINLINNKYVDNISTDSLSENVINQLLAKLDPHSVYIPSDNLADVNDELMGNFQGIGIEYQIFHDTVFVVKVLKDGPSEKAGLVVGDAMLKANDTTSLINPKNKPLDIRKILRGPLGSAVKLKILHDGKKIDKVIVRGMVTVPSVEVAYIIAPKIGYLKINKFAEHTYQEFMQNMEKLQKKGMEQLILDLRGNPGGLMSEATSIADEFLSDDKLIVYTKGEKSIRNDYRCSKDGLFEKGKLIVLVDETSASASEVLSGALQDWDRATIVGRRSFGKGLVQQQFLLSNGAALRLTVARYYTPLGRNIQKSYKEGNEKYKDELKNRLMDGELINGDTTKPTTIAFKTPAGHLVYGGGGITPDLFVPLDTFHLHKLETKLYYSNSLWKYVYLQYIQHKTVFSKVNSLKELESLLVTIPTDWKQITEMAKEEGFVISAIDEDEKSMINHRLLSLFARQVLGNEAYFEAFNQTDEIVKKGLSLLH